MTAIPLYGAYQWLGSLGAIEGQLGCAWSRCGLPFMNALEYCQRQN